MRNTRWLYIPYNSIISPLYRPYLSVGKFRNLSFQIAPELILWLSSARRRWSVIGHWRSVSDCNCTGVVHCDTVIIAIGRPIYLSTAWSLVMGNSQRIILFDSCVYVLNSVVLGSQAVVGALQPHCPAQCESLLFVIAVNVRF